MNAKHEGDGTLINQVTVIRMTQSVYPQVENSLKVLDQLLKTKLVVVEGFAPTQLLGDSFKSALTMVFLKEAADLIESVYEIWEQAIEAHVPGFFGADKEKKEEWISLSRGSLFPTYQIVLYDLTADKEPINIRSYSVNDVYFNKPRIRGNALHPYPELDFIHCEVVRISDALVKAANVKNLLMVNYI